MKYKSEIFEVIHQDAAANFEIGAISAAEMREFDEMCLAQEPETAKDTVFRYRRTNLVWRKRYCHCGYPVHAEGTGFCKAVRIWYHIRKEIL
jgi:DNA-binding transcriptional regulator YiaG